MLDYKEVTRADHSRTPLRHRVRLVYSVLGALGLAFGWGG